MTEEQRRLFKKAPSSYFITQSSIRHISKKEQLALLKVRVVCLALGEINPQQAHVIAVAIILRMSLRAL